MASSLEGASSEVQQGNGVVLEESMNYDGKESVTQLPEKIKFSLNLFEDDIDAIEKIASWRHSTKTEAIRGALATEKLLREAVRRGARVLIDEPGQPIKQIVFP